MANILAVLSKEGRLKPDYADEIVIGTCVLRDGAVANGPAAELLGMPHQPIGPAPAPATATAPGPAPDPRGGPRAHDRQPDRHRRVPDHPGPGRLRGPRGRGQGAEHSAHPADVGSNAIHGIVLVGALLVTGEAHGAGQGLTLGFIAVLLATLNVVGGFVVTDRMLQMFKSKPAESRAKTDATGGPSAGAAQ